MRTIDEFQAALEEYLGMPLQKQNEGNETEFLLLSPNGRLLGILRPTQRADRGESFGSHSAFLPDSWVELCEL